jgi:hypothetical protein
MGFPFARVEASPLRRGLASQRGRIEFAFATDDSVRLPLLSTPPRGDAVTVSYQAGVGLPEEDLHLPELNTLARARLPGRAGGPPWLLGKDSHRSLTCATSGTTTKRTRTKGSPIAF